MEDGAWNLPGVSEVTVFQAFSANFCTKALRFSRLAFISVLASCRRFLSSWSGVKCEDLFFFGFFL
jgi:hypothetical protein